LTSSCEDCNFLVLDVMFGEEDAKKCAGARCACSTLLQRSVSKERTRMPL
jgi:hypothetical protein